jgi:hypothetical protein
MVDQPAAESWPHTSTVVTRLAERAQLQIKAMLAEAAEPVGTNVKNIAYGQH